MTCPECRREVDHAPAPNYIVRQLVDKFITLPMFMEDGETPEQHKAQQQEEAAIVEKDRQSPEGLFKGRFKPRTRVLPFARIRDVEDGVERCPQCHWEIEDESDVCGHCGLDFAGGHSSDVDYYDHAGFDTMDDDEAVDYLDDDFDGTGVVHPDVSLAHALSHSLVTGHFHDHHAAHRGPRFVHDSSPESEYSGEGMDEDEHDGFEDENSSEESEDEDTSMDGFIDQEEDEEEESGDSASNPVSISSSPMPAPASDDDGGESGSGDDDGLMEDESDAPEALQIQSSTVPAAVKRRRGHRPIVIESSDSEEEREEETDEEPVVRRRGLRRT